jgi:hypothetical protein
MERTLVMSDDSFIGVISGDSDSLGRISAWYVASGMMPSLEDPESEEIFKHKARLTLPFSSREAALVAAHDKLKGEIYPPEYGVVEIQ